MAEDIDDTLWGICAGVQDTANCRSRAFAEKFKTTSVGHWIAINS